MQYANFPKPLCSTCGVTIFRQTLLPHLDATNPTGTGMLAFLFSTVEIGVAVSLACVPFLRPLFRGTFGSSNGSNKANNSSGGYILSNSHPKRVRRSQGFDELNDNASEIPLHTVDGSPQDIAVKVETTWKVESAPATQTSSTTSPPAGHF